jgi:hypothetical protein
MLHRKGGLIGTDLSDIANPLKLSSIRDALTIVQHSVSTDGRHDSALAPLASDQSHRAITRDGQTITGALRNLFYDPNTLIPTEYDKRLLLPDEFQDLLAFLSRQGHVPVPRAEEVMQ